MKNVTFKQFPLAPSKGINPKIVEQHFIWRKTGKYHGPSTIQLGDMKEPLWWNRPYKSDVIYKQEPDGLYSYNLPFIGRRNDFKTGYNILVNKNSIPIILLLKVDHTWTLKQKNTLQQLGLKAVYEALIALGVDETQLKRQRNDILYNHKKFMGWEDGEYGGWYGGAGILTLDYSSEQDIFARLTGEHALDRGITGIMEETPGLFTKKQLIDMIFKKFEEILLPLYKE